MIFYYTEDSENGIISEYAMISVIIADTLEDAEEKIGGRLTKADFCDCWMKFRKEPKAEFFEPFDPEEVRVLGPGQHSGGFTYWATPIPDVYIVDYIK